jgi:hypothetical protein
MKILLTPARVRSVIADARTEKDIELSLRRHRIRYSYNISTGFMAFHIPARSGPIIVYRTASRSAPFTVRTAAPAPAFPVLPRLYND